MADYLEAKYTKNNLYKLYKLRVERGDYEGALGIIKKMQDNSVEKPIVYLLFAKTYYELKLFKKAIYYWFKYLTVCEEEDRCLAYNGLGACYYNMQYKTVAGRYFQLQKDSSFTKNFEYNDVLLEFFDDILNVKEDFYIAYPYDKADFTKLLNYTKFQIDFGLYEEAQKKLEIIPENSRFYKEKLFQLALCRYNLGDKMGALKLISNVVELEPKNYKYVCYAISFFNAEGKTDMVDMYLEYLYNTNFESSVDGLFTASSVFCQLKEYKLAEKYLTKILNEWEYDVTSIYMLAVTKYNLQQYEKAEEYFSKYFRLTDLQFAKYYVKLCRTAMTRKSQNKIVLPIDYAFELPSSRQKVLASKFEEILEKGVLTEKNFKDILEFASYAFSGHSVYFQKLAFYLLERMPFELTKDVFLDVFIKREVYENIKIYAIEKMLNEGYTGKIFVTFGDCFVEPNIAPLGLDGDNSSVFNRAYSKAISYLSTILIDFDKFKGETFKFYRFLYENNLLYVISDESALCQALIEKSNCVKNENKKDFAKLISANPEETEYYKSYIDKMDEIEFEKYDFNKFNKLDDNEIAKIIDSVATSFVSENEDI